MTYAQGSSEGTGTSLLCIESIVCTAIGPKKVLVAKLLVECRQRSERSWGSGGRRYIQTDKKLQMLQRRK